MGIRIRMTEFTLNMPWAQLLRNSEVLFRGWISTRNTVGAEVSVSSVIRRQNCLFPVWPYFKAGGVLASRTDDLGSIGDTQSHSSAPLLRVSYHETKWGEHSRGKISSFPFSLLYMDSVPRGLDLVELRRRPRHVHCMHCPLNDSPSKVAPQQTVCIYVCLSCITWSLSILW